MTQTTCLLSIFAVLYNITRCTVFFVLEEVNYE